MDPIVYIFQGQGQGYMSGSILVSDVGQRNCSQNIRNRQ